MHFVWHATGISVLPKLWLADMPRVWPANMPRVWLAGVPGLWLAVMPRVWLAGVPRLWLAVMPGLWLAVMPRVWLADMPRLWLANMPRVWLSRLRGMLAMSKQLLPGRGTWVSRAVLGRTGGQNYFPSPRLLRPPGGEKAECIVFFSAASNGLWGRK